MGNKLILGTVQMGIHYGVNNSHGKISKNESMKILDYAYSQGISTLDSAEAYGNAHEIIGLFHKKFSPKKFKIITKIPKKIDEEIEEIVNRYLDDLRVNSIEALMFHSYDSYRNNLELLNKFKELKLCNKIKKIGVSLYTNEEIENTIMNDDIDLIQVPFNLFDNYNLRFDVLNKAKKRGIEIHSRSALLQGLFYKNPNENSLVVRSLKNELLKIKEISNTNNISLSQLALGYCLSQSFIDNVLIGVDCLDQLKENIRSSKNMIDSSLVSEINNFDINKDLINPTLW